MRARAFFFIILSGLMWGTSGLFVHFMSPYGFTSLQMTALRGSIAFVAMLGFVLIRNRSALRVSARDLLLFVAIGFCLFGAAASYFFAMQLTSVATAVVLMYTSPIYVTIFSALFFGERFNKIKLIAVALMLVGCCFVSGVVGGMKFHPLGIFLGILSGVTYGGYNILTKIAMRRNCAATSTTLYGFLVMAITAISVCNPGEIPSHIAKHPALLLPLVILLGLVTYVFPYTLYTIGLRDLPAGTASALGIVEPMAATVFSIIVIKEPMTVFSVLGILLILGAVFLLSRGDADAKESA